MCIYALASVPDHAMQRNATNIQIKQHRDDEPRAYHKQIHLLSNVMSTWSLIKTYTAAHSESAKEKNSTAAMWMGERMKHMTTLDKVNEERTKKPTTTPAPTANTKQKQDKNSKAKILHNILMCPQQIIICCCFLSLQALFFNGKTILPYTP